MILRALTTKSVRLQPVRPSAAEKDWYCGQLQALITAMHESVMYWVKIAWKKAGLAHDGFPLPPPDMIFDKSPAKILEEQMNKLGDQWQTTFDQQSKKIAQGFADKTLRHHDLAFKESLRKAGISVKMQLTPEIVDALDASIFENVSLIKSIPQKYFADVAGKVARSVMAGRSLKELTSELQQVYNLTHSRAALIARDQNNKATAVIHKTRQKQVGIKKAVWVHSGASMHPREEHEEWGAEGAQYDIEQGMYSDVDDEYVWPGTPINCGCTCMSIVPGMDESETETEEAS